MSETNIKGYIEFKAIQFFRLRGITIPSDSEGQKTLLATIPQNIKRQWAKELIDLGA
ncbi:MAG: hypothetical protein AAF236_02255 [Verrucomicrobiota bacterium]